MHVPNTAFQGMLIIKVGFTLSWVVCKGRFVKSYESTLKKGLKTIFFTLENY